MRLVEVNKKKQANINFERDMMAARLQNPELVSKAKVITVKDWWPADEDDFMETTTVVVPVGGSRLIGQINVGFSTLKAAELAASQIKKWPALYPNVTIHKELSDSFEVLYGDTKAIKKWMAVSKRYPQGGPQYDRVLGTLLGYKLDAIEKFISGEWSDRELQIKHGLIKESDSALIDKEDPMPEESIRQYHWTDRGRHKRIPWNKRILGNTRIGFDREMMMHRLKNPQLIGQSKVITFDNNHPTVAIPVGGSRIVGEVNIIFDNLSMAEHALKALRQWPDLFPNVHIYSFHWNNKEFFSVLYGSKQGIEIWKKTTQAMRDGKFTDNLDQYHQTLGTLLGYKKKAIDDFISGEYQNHLDDLHIKHNMRRQKG